jgi:hypothetical protein
VHLESDGARIREGWDDPRSAPGFRVTRHGGDTIEGRALGLAGLPCGPAFGRLHALSKVALGPSEPFIVSYEDLTGAPLTADSLPPLDAAAWDWLLEDVVRGVKRRAHGDAPFVGPVGRPVAWQSGQEGVVRPGDLAVAAGWVALLEEDDGDGWLGSLDRAIHGASGRVARGTLADLPEGELAVRRLRDLGDVARLLEGAGYGALPRSTLWTAAARRAMKDFQRDRGLPTTGAPDEASRRSLAEFVGRLDAASASPDSAR